MDPSSLVQNKSSTLKRKLISDTNPFNFKEDIIAITPGL